MAQITVFNQTNRIVIFDEAGHELAPLGKAEVEGTDPVAAFAIESGFLVVLSSIGVAQEAAPEVEPIQAEEPVSEEEPEPAEEAEESTEEAEEPVEEVKPAPRTRKKTSTQVKES